MIIILPASLQPALHMSGNLLSAPLLLLLSELIFIFMNRQKYSPKKKHKTKNEISRGTQTQTQTQTRTQIRTHTHTQNQEQKSLQDFGGPKKLNTKLHHLSKIERLPDKSRVRKRRLPSQKSADDCQRISTTTRGIL